MIITAPGIDEVLNKCQNVTIISSVDLRASFWQVGLHKESRKYCAFSVNGRCFEFCRVPYGLKVSQAALQAALDPLIDKLPFVINFVDDFLIVSQSVDQHMQHLTQLFEIFIDYNLTSKFDKCRFALREARFLGHIITPKGIQPQPEKIDIIKNFKRPKSQTTAIVLRLY